MSVDLNLNTVLLVLVTIFIAWIGYNNKTLAKAITELKDYVKEMNLVIFAELKEKQDIGKCTLYHDGHKDVHALEKEANDLKVGKIQKDNDKLGKMVRGGN